jgi:hypothetical protein
MATGGAPNLCTTCYGTNLVLQGGFLTCADCGTQAQVRREGPRLLLPLPPLCRRHSAAAAAQRPLTPSPSLPHTPPKQKQAILEETEYGDVAQGRGRRAIRAVRAEGTGQPDESAAREQQLARRGARSAALLYTRALQGLARQQARALHERLGAHEDVEALVRQLWLPAVAASGVLEPEFVERDAPSAAAGDTAPTTTTRVVERRPEALQRRLLKALPPQTTLAVAFAALALAREPVVPADVLGWALDGRLPFAELAALAQPLLQRCEEEQQQQQQEQRQAQQQQQPEQASGVTALVAGALRAQVTYSPAQLANRAEELVAIALLAGGEGAALSRRRPLLLPPANGEALLRRLARDLAAAAAGPSGKAAPCDAAVSLASDLHDMYLLGTPALAFVREMAAGRGVAAIAGPWAPGAGPPPQQPQQQQQQRQQDLAILVPVLQQQQQDEQQQQHQEAPLVALRAPLAVLAAGGGAATADEDGGGSSNAGASLPTWVGQGLGRHAHPFAAVAATLVVALKLLHGSLEGGGEEEQEQEQQEQGGGAGPTTTTTRHDALPSVVPGPAGGWQRWAWRAVQRGPQPPGGGDEDALLTLPRGAAAAAGGGAAAAAKARRAFLVAARRHAFAGSGPPEALEDVQNVLLMLARAEEEDEEEEEEEEEEVVEEDGNAIPSRAGSKRRRGAAASAAATSAAVVDADAADGRYLLARNPHKARASPDYVAVLTAVAAHAHTDPFTLHALVRHLEKRMLAAESSLRALAGGGGGEAEGGSGGEESGGAGGGDSTS